MECTNVKRTFKVVGIKGHGAYENFGHDVPKLAQKFLVRKDEIESQSDIEIALFEPKRDADHLEGHYYVGLMVNESLNTVPEGMDYIELAQNYVTVRGEISNIGGLHDYLLKWSDENGYKRALQSHIVETYHAMENGKEEVEIYLPVQV